jgi:hypothetical protein
MSKLRNSLLAGALVAALAGQAQGAAISGLFNTGTDANNVALAGGFGVADPHWTILSSTSPGFAGQQAVTFNCCYLPDDGDSRWVSLSSSGTPGLNTTVYRLSFDLTGLNAATAQISGLFGGDNLATIVLNGVDTANATGQFSFLTPFSISSGFVAGLNTLDVRVSDGGPPTAFRIDNLAGTAELAGAAVPEPATWAMMLIGFFGLGSMVRSRRGLSARMAA